MYFLVVFQPEPQFLHTISLYCRYAESRHWFGVRRNQGQELESNGGMTREHETGIPRELQDLHFSFYERTAHLSSTDVNDSGLDWDIGEEVGNEI